MSDDVDEIVILTSSTIIISSCALLFNEVIKRKGVILSEFEVTCCLAVAGADSACRADRLTKFEI